MWALADAPAHARYLCRVAGALLTAELDAGPGSVVGRGLTSGQRGAQKVDRGKAGAFRAMQGGCTLGSPAHTSYTGSQALVLSGGLSLPRSS